MIALPLLVVIITGILLLLKKEFDLIQPPTQRGISATPSVSFEQVLRIAKSVESAEINSWKDIDRLDVRPSKGVIKVRSHNEIEIQIDSESGNVLQVAQRNSDFIESLHDGTFFQKNANLWLMLPSAIIALVLLITGLILFFQPYLRSKTKSR